MKLIMDVVCCTWLRSLGLLSVTPVIVGLAASELSAQSMAGSDPHPELHLFAAADFGLDPYEITFTKDIAPILQRSCQSCHREAGVAPMPLTTYQDVRRYATRIKDRTAIRDRMGAMPPWYLEKDIGVQGFKDDPSLSDEELAKIQAWVDNGAPQGNPSDMPPPLEFPDHVGWQLGEPDLVVRGPDVTMPAIGPDRWTNLGLVPTGATEDRYVRSLEVREMNDVDTESASGTVGGRYIFHHMTYNSVVLNEDGTPAMDEETTGWPVHEVGRNADVLGEKSGRLLQANSALNLRAAHLHSNNRETTAHLEFGFRYFPKGYEPEYVRGRVSRGNTTDIDVVPGKDGQEFHHFVELQEHIKYVSFEPHLHAPGTRFCIEAIWGRNTFTLNCAGYDHNWVKQYVYEEDAAPLLPKGTILHTIGFLDTSEANPNVADHRNWAGGGRRSVANMFIDLGQLVRLTEEQFQAELAERRAKMKSRNEYDVGCFLCWAEIPTMESMPTTEEKGGAQ